MSYHRSGVALHSASALGFSLLRIGKKQKPHCGGQPEKCDSPPIGVHGIEQTGPRPTAKTHPHRNAPYFIVSIRPANGDLTFLLRQLKTSSGDSLPRLRPILSVFRPASR